MGEAIVKFIIGTQGVFLLVGLIITIIFIVRRKKIKKTEDFEQRNN